MRRARGWTSALVLFGLVVVASLAAVWITRVEFTDDSTLQERVLSIAGELHAPGDQNTMTVATSTLDTAQHMRYEIQQDLLAGMTRNQVLQAMQQEYGKDVLAAPEVQGFGSAAWLAPWLFLVILSGIAIVYGVRKAKLISVPGPVKSFVKDDVLDEKAPAADENLHNYL